MEPRKAGQKVSLFHDLSYSRVRFYLYSTNPPLAGRSEVIDISVILKPRLADPSNSAKQAIPIDFQRFLQKLASRQPLLGLALCLPESLTYTTRDLSLSSHLVSATSCLSTQDRYLSILSQAFSSSQRIFFSFNLLLQA